MSHHHDKDRGKRQSVVITEGSRTAAAVQKLRASWSIPESNSPQPPKSTRASSTKFGGPELQSSSSTGKLAPQTVAAKAPDEVQPAVSRAASTTRERRTSVVIEMHQGLSGIRSRGSLEGMQMFGLVAEEGEQEENRDKFNSHNSLKNESVDGDHEEENEIPPLGIVMQKAKLFQGCSVQLLRQLAGEFEERIVRTGEVIYKEGERQNWLGLLEVGSASVNISLSESGSAHAGMRYVECHAGTVFGELAALGVRETRSSTLIAESDARVLILDGRELWEIAEQHPEWHTQLQQLCDQWRAFLHCPFFAGCHPEAAYQLRTHGESITMLHSESALLSSDAEQNVQGVKRYDAAVIVENGRLFCLGDKKEAHTVSAIVNENLALGMCSSVMVQASDGACCVTFLSRNVLWHYVGALTKEREHFMKMALERLPPSTSDICSCPLLANMQGTPSFWRIIQNLVRQRVCHPGMDIILPTENSDSLIFFQQGSADVFIQNYQIGKIEMGGYCGDLLFLSIASGLTVKVRARDFCVLQTVQRTEFEPHLQRIHPVRSRFRELSKSKPLYKRDALPGEQIQILKDTKVFGGKQISESFLEDIYKTLEDRMYLEGQHLTTKGVPTECMYILLAGTAIQKKGDGQEISIGPDHGVDCLGELGLLCVNYECKDTVMALSVCSVQVLHRLLFLETLKAHPSEKEHFERIAKAQTTRRGSTESQMASDIYMLPFFKRCSGRFLYLLELHFERHMFFSDEIIVKEGTEGESMYILYSGCANVRVCGTKVAELYGGQCFGEMAVLGLAKKRTATIAARTLCDVRILSSHSLEAAIKEFPEERAMFESLAATRNRITNEAKVGGKVKQTAMFFKGCDPKFAEAICELMEDKLYMQGQVIMKEGEQGDCMYLLHQGHAEISCNGVAVAELGDTEVFGEMAVLGLSPVRAATVTATMVCFVQVLKTEDLLRVLQDFPQERPRLRLKAAHRLESRFTYESVRTLDFFRNSPMQFNDFIDQHTRHRVYFNKEVIAQEGTVGQTFYVIFSGRARVDIGGFDVAELGAGDFVGELCALDISSTRSATVTCKDICDVYTLDYNILQEAWEKWPEQRTRLMQVAARRMRINVERKTEGSFLSKCPLFAKSSTKFLQCIALNVEDKIYMPGENLCNQGEQGDTMFILVSGICDVLIGGAKVNELQQGSVIGEIAVLGLSSVRTATLRASTACLAQLLHRPIFMKYLAEFPREMVQFQEVGTARLENLPVSSDENIFKKQPLFKGCDAAFLAELLKHLHRKFFFGGQKIVKEGSDSNEMYAIQQGHAVTERREVVIGAIGVGGCFGEMAVMGITMTQSVTVRAEVLCDMQVLSRWELEELMKDHRQERRRLLRVIAAMMREELSDVTNLEIITEIPIFREADHKFLEAIEQASEAELARKEELMLHEGEEAMFVLLQGMARVELRGTPLRNLSEGDNFGAVGVLGTAGSKDHCKVAVRATSVCLFLMITKKALDDVVARNRQAYKFIEELKKNLWPQEESQSPSARRSSRCSTQDTFLECSLLQHLQLTVDNNSELRAVCEEIVVMPKEPVLHDDSELLIFVMSGSLTATSGPDTFMIQKGSAHGDLSVDNTWGVAPTVFGQEVSRLLLLWRSVFFAVLDSWPAEMKAEVLARLDSVPRQRVNNNRAIQNACARQRTDWLVASYIKAVSMSLRVKVGKPKAVGPHKNKFWKTVRRQALLQKITNAFERPDHDDQVKTKTKPEMEKDHQEQLLRQDLHRLTALAKQASGEANAEQVRLRRQADALRRKAKLLDYDCEKPLNVVETTTSNDRNHDAFCVGPVSPPVESAEISELRRRNAVAERRVQQLRAKLEQAYQQREEVMREMSQM